MQPVAGTNVIPFRARSVPPKGYRQEHTASLEGPAIVITLPPPGANPNRVTFEEMAEMLAWENAVARLVAMRRTRGALSVHEPILTIAEQADPPNGQLERIGRTPDGHDYFIVERRSPGDDDPMKPLPLYRRTVFEKVGAHWFVWHRPTWTGYSGRGYRHPTLRAALELYYGTVAEGVRPAHPDDPPGGYDGRDHRDNAPQLPLPERWRRRTWDGSPGLDRRARRSR